MKKIIFLLAAAVAASSALASGCTNDKPSNSENNTQTIVRSLTEDNGDCPDCPENPDGENQDGDKCPDGNCGKKLPHPEHGNKFKDGKGWQRRKRKDKDGLNPEPPRVPAPIPAPKHGNGENS